MTFTSFLFHAFSLRDEVRKKVEQSAFCLHLCFELPKKGKLNVFFTFYFIFWIQFKL